jgi:hypothetical protein
MAATPPQRTDATKAAVLRQNSAHIKFPDVSARLADRQLMGNRQLEAAQFG